MSLEHDEDDLSWLDQFDDLADQQLGDGSACTQVHPIVEKWFQDWLEAEEGDPPLRGSISQAVACLATEVLDNTPQPILDALMESCDEDDVYNWIQNVLMTGKAFQQALDNGQLDDL